MIEEAKALAEKLHEGQTRKYSGKPYFSHCEDVANLVRHWTDNENYIAAAYLHDTIEDCCGVDYDFIKQQTNEVVAHLVLELTNRSVLIHSKKNRAARKKMDIEAIAKSSYIARLIKLCERLCNIKDMSAHDSKFVRVYAKESIELVKEIWETNATLTVQILLVCFDILET